MQDELLRKVKKNRRRRATILLLIAVFLAASFVGLRITGADAKLGIGGKGTATIEIRCDELVENPDALTKPQLAKYIPKNGIILKETSVSFEKGTTVYEILDAVCKENQIHIESKYDATYRSYYVRGIHHLYEFDGGKRSGWLYTINGKQPNYGANKVKLKHKDKVVWFYTIDYTKERK